ncbi:hypothetical protein ACFYVR_23325 [Rhodococcus sp. NPDC003318]|uniref:hypothetical protein n=1 Tax=Rhodococcus sp. NPDC003318 TaxID=3364503 RepID=UPI0036A7A527
MSRKSIAATLIPAALAAGLAACSSDEEPSAAPISILTAPAPATESPFGADAISKLGVKIERDNATAIVETVEQRGGTPKQAIAALLATEAETGWRSGSRMAPPATDIRDIFGWRLAYNLAADSADVVRAATNTFMDNAGTVTISVDDPCAYALAVQKADPRGYNEAEHFYKKGETAAGEYAAALPKAQEAYTELRGSQ